jgi:hypothetical protein
MPYQHASNWRAQERTLYGENRPEAEIGLAEKRTIIASHEHRASCGS